MGFSASLSGLNANQQKLSVIGNNLANINTVGFKSSSVQFMDLVSQSIGGSSANPMQVGLGVTTGAISPNFTQGGLENTGVQHATWPSRAAASSSSAAARTTARSRAPATSRSTPTAALVTLRGPGGAGLHGHRPGDRSDRHDRAAERHRRSRRACCARPAPTTLFGTVSNLDAAAVVGDTFTASVQIYDALGDVHVATITYTNTGPGAWGYDIIGRWRRCHRRHRRHAGLARTGNVTFGATGAADGAGGRRRRHEPGLGQRRRGDQLHVGSLRQQRDREPDRLCGHVGHLVDHAERLRRRHHQSDHHRLRLAAFRPRSAPAARSSSRSWRWPTSTTRRGS